MKRIISVLLCGVLLLGLCACEKEDKTETDYLRAVELYNSERYADAAVAFQLLDGYKDSVLMTQKSRYQVATDLYLNGKYEEAKPALEALGGFRKSAELANDCAYRMALEAYREGDYKDAITGFEKLGADYLDCGDYIREYQDSQLRESLVGTWKAQSANMADLLNEHLAELSMAYSDFEAEEAEKKEEKSDKKEDKDDKDGEEDDQEEKDSKKSDETEKVTVVEPRTGIARFFRFDDYRLNFELKLSENGTFTLTMVDEPDEKQIKELGERFYKNYIEFLTSVLESEAKKWGSNQSKYLAVVKGVGSVEEFITKNVDIEKMVETAIAEPIRALYDVPPVFGAYQVKDGKLTLYIADTAEEIEINSETGTLTLQGKIVGTDSAKFYPLEFTKEKKS